MSGSTSAGLGLRQMPRIPLQVLVLPFRQGTDGVIEYAVFRRSDYGDDCWQGLAGGAEEASQPNRQLSVEQWRKPASPWTRH